MSKLHDRTTALARSIVRNYSWVADRDIPAEGVTTEEVFAWYVQEAAARGEVTEYEFDAVLAECVRLYDSGTR